MKNRFNYLIFFLQLLFASQNGDRRSNDTIVAAFTLKDIDGRSYPMQENLGKKITAIVFWSTWGNDSMRMLRDLQQYYTKYHSVGMQVIGVCVENQSITPKDIVRVREVVNLEKITFPNLIDEQLSTFQAYSVVAVPTLIIVSQSMKILFKFSGYPLTGQDELFSFIRSTFEQNNKSTPENANKYIPNKDALRYSNMAIKKYEKGDIESAIKYVEKAQHFDSLFYSPIFLSIEISLELNDTLKASKLLSQAIQLETESNEKIILQSILLAKTRRAKEAVETLGKSVTKNSLNAKERAMYAYVLGKAGLIQQSLNEFQKAESQDSTEFRIPLFRMQVYKHASLDDLAKKDSILVKKLRR